MKKIWIPQSIIIIMLIIALNPSNPYGYYILLRWICFGSFAYLAYRAHNQEKSNWAWVLGILSFVYNPIIRFYLTREFWTIINLITMALSIASIFVIRRKNHATKESG